MAICNHEIMFTFLIGGGRRKVPEILAQLRCLEHNRITTGTLGTKRNLRWAAGTLVTGRVVILSFHIRCFRRDGGFLPS